MIGVGGGVGSEADGLQSLPETASLLYIMTRDAISAAVAWVTSLLYKTKCISAAAAWVTSLLYITARDACAMPETRQPRAPGPTMPRRTELRGDSEEPDGVD